MKLIVKDSIPAACATIARDIQSAQGHQTMQAYSTEDVLRLLSADKDAIGIVAFFLEDPRLGLDLMQKVRDFCSVEAIRCPRFVVRTPGDLSSAHGDVSGYYRRFRAFDAECIVAGSMEQLNWTIRKMISEQRCENGKPTFVVERTPYTRFWLLGAVERALFAIGPRQLSLMNHFAINFGCELSTVNLAEAADLTLPSVPVYLARLRQRFDETAKPIGLNFLGKDVFRTFRKDGGFVHLLCARVLFN